MPEVTFTSAPTGPNAPPTPAASDRPSWLPENFAAPEDFAKSYGELHAEFTRTRQELSALKGEQTPAEGQPPAPNPAAPTASATSTEQPPAGTNNDQPQEQKPAESGAEADAAKQVADAAGFDLNPFHDEYETSGDVSQDSRAKIADGLKAVLGEGARQLVDDYIEGQKLIVQNDRKLFMDTAGGEENYNAMLAWAAEGMQKEQKEAYNRQINSGDRHAVLFAIEGLKAKYEAANGRAPNVILTGGGGGAVTEAGYKSSAEMRRDMADPKYKTDPAFREMVKRKLAISPF
jgi:hypothetical protein